MGESLSAAGTFKVKETAAGLDQLQRICILFVWNLSLSLSRSLVLSLSLARSLSLYIYTCMYTVYICIYLYLYLIPFCVIRFVYTFSGIAFESRCCARG